MLEPAVVITYPWFIFTDSEFDIDGLNEDTLYQVFVSTDGSLENGRELQIQTTTSTLLPQPGGFPISIVLAVLAALLVLSILCCVVMILLRKKICRRISREHSYTNGTLPVTLPTLPLNHTSPTDPELGKNSAEGHHAPMLANNHHDAGKVDEVEMMHLLNKDMQCNGSCVGNRVQTLTVSSGYTSDPESNQDQESLDEDIVEETEDLTRGVPAHGLDLGHGEEALNLTPMDSISSSSTGTKDPP